MPRSQAERLWMIGGGLVGLVMVLIGYLFFISPQRSDTSNVDGQVQSAQSSNDVLQAKLDKLREQNKNLAQFQAQAGQARLALPDTNGLSAFLRTLQQIGGATRTDVSSLVAGNPVDVSSVLTGVAASTAAPSANPTAAPAAATPAATPAGGARVWALPITTTVSGSVDALNQFLTQLQSVQPRAVLISQLTETAGSSTQVTTASQRPGVPTLSLTMYAFVSPGTASESAQLQAAAGK